MRPRRLGHRRGQAALDRVPCASRDLGLNLGLAMPDRSREDRLGRSGHMTSSIGVERSAPARGFAALGHPSDCKPSSTRVPGSTGGRPRLAWSTERHGCPGTIYGREIRRQTAARRRSALSNGGNGDRMDALPLDPARRLCGSSTALGRCRPTVSTHPLPSSQARPLPRRTPPHDSSRRHPQRGDHRPRRPRQDNPGRRHAPAVRAVPRQPAPGPVHPRLE